MKEDFNAWLILTIIWALTFFYGCYQKYWLWKKKSTSFAAIELNAIVVVLTFITFLFFLSVTIAKC